MKAKITLSSDLNHSDKCFFITKIMILSSFISYMNAFYVQTSENYCSLFALAYVVIICQLKELCLMHQS